MNKQAAARLLKEDPDYFKRIGSKGGKVAPGPFATNRELAARAGRKGGKISRRFKDA